MKWMFLYLWHGQDVGVRLVFGLIATGLVFTPEILKDAGWAMFTKPEVVVPAVLAFLVGATGRRNGGK